MVESNRTQGGAQSHLLHSQGGGLMLMIHIEECGGAGFYHLQTSQPGSPIHILVCKLGLVGPDFFFQPGHQRHIIRKTTKERHRCMGMGIHKPGNHSFSSAIQTAIRSNGKRWAHLPDILSFNQDISNLSPEQSPFYQYAHKRSFKDCLHILIFSFRIRSSIAAKASRFTAANELPSFTSIIPSWSFSRPPF
jgi:hypothetical protein